jgi:Na+/H+ antiporter NhaD/arsenite permease-like protein
VNVTLPVEFVLFGLTLLGVALAHERTLEVAATGVAAIVAYKLAVTGFAGTPGWTGLGRHLATEWVGLVNLFLLLMGFALLAHHFRESRVPDLLPDYLPNDWRGGFVLLALVFVLSGFLDNIAAALVGGAVASTVYRERVHVGYLVAIVAAANAGGAGSVVGDTTTTMMWISGVSPRAVLHAYVAAGAALLVFGIPASLQQQRHSPIIRHTRPGVRADWARMGVVAFTLVAAVAANVTINVKYPALAAQFPFIGATVMGSIALASPLRAPDWSIVPATLRGATFLLCLVFAASLMPVERLPAASWPSALALGFVSAVFDNIPLTKLALEQGGYDWGALAYAVGFGGSMVWFGSSAGVALTSEFPAARSVGAWVRSGWHVALGFVTGFFVLLATLGWRPHA